MSVVSAFHLTANSSSSSAGYLVTMATAQTSTGNNVSSSSVEQHLQGVYRVIGFTVVAIIFIVGLLGNVLVVWVVTLTRAMHTPTNCYLVSLAIADILLLASGPSATLVEFVLGMHGQILFGSLACPAMVFTQYLGVNVSSLCITTFTVERYIAICHPMRSQTICTVSHAKKVICALWTFGIVYCAPWLYLAQSASKPHSNGSTVEFCNHRLDRTQYTFYYTIDLVIFYIVPLLLTCVLYGLIARVLFADRPSHHLHNNHSTSTVVASRSSSNGYERSPSHGGATSSFSHGGQPSSRSMSNQRYQVIKMLAVVVGMFAVLWLPYRALVVYNSFASKTSRNTDLWFVLFCRVMIYINSAINPILYNAMSVKFRDAFKRQLTCRRLPDAERSYVPVPGTASTMLPSSGIHRPSQTSLPGRHSSSRPSQVSLAPTGRSYSTCSTAPAHRASQLSFSITPHPSSPAADTTARLSLKP